jgi:hypothetical protein
MQNVRCGKSIMFINSYIGIFDRLFTKLDNMGHNAQQEGRQVGFTLKKTLACFLTLYSSGPVILSVALVVRRGRNIWDCRRAR